MKITPTDKKIADPIFVVARLEKGENRKSALRTFKCDHDPRYKDHECCILRSKILYSSVHCIQKHQKFCEERDEKDPIKQKLMAKQLSQAVKRKNQKSRPKLSTKKKTA